jgi:hypothetical protein
LHGRTYPSGKYESQWEGLSHVLWIMKICLKPPTKYGITWNNEPNAIEVSPTSP